MLLTPKTVWESLSAEWENLCHIEFSIHDVFKDHQPRRTPFRSGLSLDALVGPVLLIWKVILLLFFIITVHLSVKITLSNCSLARRHGAQHILFLYLVNGI